MAPNSLKNATPMPVDVSTAILCRKKTEITISLIFSAYALQMFYLHEDGCSWSDAPFDVVAPAFCSARGIQMWPEEFSSA